MKHQILAILFAILISFSSFSQSIKYNGDIEVGVVASSNFASAQINTATTHGAYFSRHGLFVGAGAAIGWNIDAEFWNKVYPVYGDMRKDFTINSRFTTFIDAKAGYSFEGDSTGMVGAGLDYGFYCSPSAGLRFKIADGYGIFLKVGYTYQHATESYLWYANEYKYEESHGYNAGGFSASIGFAF